MKNIKVNLPVTFIVLLLFVSCNWWPVFTKGQYINNFEHFISKMENDYLTYDDETWETSNTRFKKFKETDLPRFEKTLTVNELAKVDRLIGRFYAIVAKHHAMQIQKKFKRIYNQAEGFIYNLSK